MVTGAGHPAEQQHDHAADGVVAALILLGDVLEFQAILHLRNRNGAIQQPGTILALDCPGIFGIARGELAGHRLQDILQGDDPFYFAIFVDDEGHLHVVGTELFQQLCAGQRFGNVDARLEVGGVVGGLTLRHTRQGLFGVDDPEQLVEAAIADREAGVLRLDQDLQVLFRRAPDVDTDDIRTRNHQRAQ
ncbi:hypothetical protein D3C78_1316730 [compost metagenome]